MAYDFETMDARYYIFATVFLLSNRLQTAMDQTMQGLTSRQWFVITMLGVFDDPPTLGQLAAACDSSHQNVKQLVLKLEQKGFVKIQEDRKDRRVKRIVTTELCRQWERENREAAATFIGQMFQNLGPQEIATMKVAQQELYETLGRMMEEHQ